MQREISRLLDEGLGRGDPSARKIAAWIQRQHINVVEKPGAARSSMSTMPK
jgi:hypothetical protein